MAPDAPYREPFRQGLSPQTRKDERVRRGLDVPAAVPLGSTHLAVGADPERVARDRHLRAAEVLHVVTTVVLAATQVEGVADLGDRSDGVGDHYVDLPVLRVGI